MEAFRLVSGAWTLTAALAGDAEARVAPFDAIAFSLADLCGASDVYHPLAIPAKPFPLTKIRFAMFLFYPHGATVNKT